MDSGFKVEGLTEFQNKLVNALRNNTRKYDELRLKIGNLLLKNAADEVKSEGLVETNRLLNSFEKKPYSDKKGSHNEWVLKLVGKDIIEAGSEVWYAKLVNDGHIQVKITRSKDKSGHNRRKKEIKGFVPGKHYFEKAMEKTYMGLPGLIEDFLRELGKEAGFDVEG